MAALIAIMFVRRALKMRSLKQYGPSEVDALLESNGDIILLDVRTAPERQAGAIRGSIHVPLQSLRSRLGELEKYKSKEIVCYCQTGNRSMSAALLLKKSGFNVANLRGGIADWNFSHR